MKKILILTDFSDQAAPALDAAVKFSAKLNANLILFNSFISQPVLSEFGGTPWSVEELLLADEGKKKLNFVKEDVEALTALLPVADHHASVNCLQGMGGLGSQVKELLEKEQVELIIMGARNGSAWSHILMGSDTVSVINHADRPVLIIPAGHPLKQLRKVTIATDFDGADLKAVHYLTRLGRLFEFTIEIVHVKLWGKNDPGDAQRLDFEKHVSKFNYPGITYDEAGGKDLANRLNNLCEANGSDLLVLVHDQHSSLNRLFNKTQAKSLLEKQQFPVLIIPAQMELH
jgi:nucleotide-binding universal stress UspA family protein